MVASMPIVPWSSDSLPVSDRPWRAAHDAGFYRGRRDDALAVADLVFADRPRIGRLDGCTFCYSEQELADLAGDPGALSDDLVRRFAEEGIDHWDEDQYPAAWRRLAGRILRLLGRRDLGVDVGLVLRGLGYSCNSVEGWPDREREAVLDVLGSTLDLWLTDGRDSGEVIELLGALAHVHDDIAPWFARIEAATDSAIEAGLVRLAARWAVDLLWNETANWWWYPDDPAGRVRQWLCSRAVQDRLTAFAARNLKCKNAADALAAIRSLATDGHGIWLYPQTYPPRPRSWMLPVVQ